MRGAALLLLFVGSPALAWDQGFHTAIYQGASRLSPVVATRVDEQNVDAFRQGLEEADLGDRDCKYHVSGEAIVPPWKKANDVLTRIRNPNPKWSARYRAMLLGQYFHYVADCAVPQSVVLGSARGRYQIDHDLLIYRERRPLAEPLDAALQARAGDAIWFDKRQDGAISEAFRAVVNLTVEAALLLPLRPGASAVEDRGPLILVPVTKVSEVNQSWTDIEESQRILHAGIHVLEWTPRTTPAGTLIRATVYNNLELCVRHLLFWSGDWAGGLTVTLPGQSIKIIELPGPARAPDDVIVRFVPGECVPEPDRPTLSTAGWRVFVFPSLGRPSFESRVKEVKPGEKGPSIGQPIYLEYSKRDQEAIGGLEILSFQATAKDGRADFKLRVKNKSETSPKPLNLALEVGSMNEPNSVWKEVTLDVTKLRKGAEQTFEGYIPAKTYGEATGVRLHHLTRGAPGRPMKW